MADPLAPGAVIGLLGGGPPARMLALAAARLGLCARIHAPEPAPPAGDVAHAVTTAPWDDRAALDAFAREVDVITPVVETVPVASLEAVAARVPVRPGPRALALAQDRLAEKAWLAEIGLMTAPYAAVDDPVDLAEAIGEIGLPARLKTRRRGDDATGQARLTDAAGAEAALAAMAGAPAILEGEVSVEREIAIIAARGAEGAVICYDPSETTHEAGILTRARVPATGGAHQRADAALAAGRILTRLDHVGVMGVEMGAARGGLIVNKIAPRVHQAGHWTELACVIDQVEQHVRAVAGWPLGDGARHSDAEMVTLLGAAVHEAPALAGDPAARIHLYGKGEARAGREMGHVTRRLGPA